jgi:hypothetical protein
VVGKISPTYDTGEKNKKTENIFLVKPNLLEPIASATLLTSIKLSQDGKNLVYGDSESINLYGFETNNNEVILKTSIISSTGVYVFNNDIYVFDKDELWSYDTKTSTSYRLAYGPSFGSVSAATVLPNGELAFSVSRGNTDTGIFVTTLNNSLIDKNSELRKILPTIAEDYKAELFFNGSVFVIDVDILGKIPSTETSRQKATASTNSFVSSIEKNSLVKVIVN